MDLKIDVNILIIILLIVIALIIIRVLHVRLNNEHDGHPDQDRQVADGNGDVYYKARGHEQESIEMLLNRIDWGTGTEKRISWWVRILLPTIIAILLVVILILRRIPTIVEVIMFLVIIFVVFFAMRQYTYIHGDIYRDAYIRHDVNIIRDKLGLKSGEPDEPIDNFLNDKTLQS